MIYEIYHRVKGADNKPLLLGVDRKWLVDYLCKYFNSSLVCDIPTSQGSILQLKNVEGYFYLYERSVPS